MIVEEGGKLLPIVGKVEKGILKAARGGKKGLERLTGRHSGEDIVPSEWTVGIAKVRSGVGFSQTSVEYYSA